jgi:hypothetical protein
MLAKAMTGAGDSSIEWMGDLRRGIAGGSLKKKLTLAPRVAASYFMVAGGPYGPGLTCMLKTCP